ncbi:hypothetical protein R5R35_001067 [Gryllus longicercus]|uniref:Uncharacterized protein n=1 Tax=Gryllus longicercus TaxID=2509291 RepID=A0AAN9ZEI3_9ORTH
MALSGAWAGVEARGVCVPWEGAGPPVAGVQWALAGAGAGGAVGVVDLGDGPRWLRALHARAAAPLLLWRPSSSLLRQGKAPAWLERQGGYVLAAHRHDHLLAFLRLHTKDAVYDGYRKEITDGAISYRNLQLSSSAPVVLAIGSRPSIGCEQKNKTAQNPAFKRSRGKHSLGHETSGGLSIVQDNLLLNSVEERKNIHSNLNATGGANDKVREGGGAAGAQLRAGRRVLAALWQRHQGFRGLLLREREGEGRW